MKTADLYIRVSTDEQADKGYSLRSQEELLRRYCDINKITIRKVIFEDQLPASTRRYDLFIYMINSELWQNKSRTNGKNSNLSCQVDLPVEFSNLFIEDLRKLANIAA